MLRTIDRMTASGARSRSRPTLLTLAVIAVALGILGMHGLGAHGVTPGVAAPPGIAAPVAAHGVEDASGAHAGHVRHVGHERPSPVEHEDGSSGMLMLCVAMLAGSAAALVVALVARARPTRPWAVLAPAPPPWLPRRLVLEIGTGPPSVWSFSVIRC